MLYLPSGEEDKKNKQKGETNEEGTQKGIREHREE